jgi:hypothetical protein
MNGANLQLIWSGNFILQSATDLPSFHRRHERAESFTVNPILPMQYFRLRSP